MQISMFDGNIQGDVMSRKEYMQEYQRTHRLKINEISLRYRESHREILKLRSKNYYRKKCIEKLKMEGVV